MRLVLGRWECGCEVVNSNADLAHGGPDGECPYCRIRELEAENARLREEVDIRRKADAEQLQIIKDTISALEGRGDDAVRDFMERDEGNFIAKTRRVMKGRGDG